MKLAIYLAIRSMWADKGTSLLLTASVVVAVSVFLVLSSLLFGFQQEFITKTVGVSPHVRITSEVAEQPLQPANRAPADPNSLQAVLHSRGPDRPDKIRGDKDIISQIKSQDSVIAVAPNLTTNVIIRSGAISYPAVLYGCLPDAENDITGLYDKAVKGAVQELKTRDKALAIGRGIAGKLGVDVGDTLRLTARDGSAYLFRIVAVVNTGITSQDNARLWANLRDVQTVANQTDEITSISIKLKDYNQAQQYAASYSKLYGYRAESWQEANSNMLDLFKIIFANIYFVLAGLLLAAGFGIYNIFGMTIINRRREIAIMQAMGIDRTTLGWNYLFQGLLVGLAGVFAGLVLGQLGIMWVETIEITTQNQYQPMDVKGFTMLQQWWLYAGSGGIGLVLSLVSAFLPAWRAGALHPVDVIREG